MRVPTGDPGLRLRSAVPCGLAALAFLVAASPAAALRIEPVVQTVPPARTVAYQAFDGEQDVTEDTEWRSLDRDLARFNPEVPGSLRTRRPGRVDVEATYGRRTAVASIVIDPGEPVRLVTRPGAKKVELDRPMSFSCRLVFESGYQEDVTPDCVWTTKNPSIAKVKNGTRAGLVLPQRLGTTVIRAKHRGTGLKNKDGSTRVLPPIDTVRFEDNTIILGRGMTTELRVYGHHGDTGVRSRLTEGLEFETDHPSLIDLVAAGEDAGDIVALEDGFAVVRVVDTVRGLGSGQENALVVVVAGVLRALEVLPNPFKLNAADTRKASVFGLLTSGLKTANLRKLVEWAVDDADIARVGNGEDDVGEVEGKQAGTTTLRAQYPEFDVASAEENNLIVRGAVTDLAIEPAEVTIGIDLVYPLRVYANRDDGGRSNISSSAEWSSEPKDIVAIDGDGQITGLNNGSTIVTAVDPKTGFEASVEVTVAGRLVGIDVKNVRLDEGTEKKAKATGRLSSGLTTSDLRLVLDWDTQNDSIAIVGDGSTPAEGERRLERGEVYGVRVGTTTLRAVEPVSGLQSTQTSNVTVRPEGDEPDPDPTPDPGGPKPGPTPVAPPSVRNVFVVVEAGNDGIVQTSQTVTYKARATRTDGTTRNISDDCQWSSDDPVVALVDNTLPKKGDVTGVNIGRTFIRADCDGLRGQAPVEVVGDVVALTIDPDSFNADVGEEKQLRARLEFSNGDHQYVTREVDWRSTNPTVAWVENEIEGRKGRVRFLMPGEALIFAVDSTGHVGTSEATVRP